MLKENIKRKIPVTIEPLNCRWEQSTKTLFIEQDGWKGIITSGEIGENLDTVYSMNIPKCILKLLKEPFKAFVIKETSDGLYVFSRKAYLEACKEKLEIGHVYDAVVSSSCTWGVFCNIGDAKVLVHIMDFSSCKFLDLRKVVKEGQSFPVRIKSKVMQKDGCLYVSASRKDVVSAYRDYSKGDVVKVILSTPSTSGNGFYCEILPSTQGIIDVPNEYMGKYTEGSEMLGIIKKYTAKGYKLQGIY